MANIRSRKPAGIRSIGRRAAVLGMALCLALQLGCTSAEPQDPVVEPSIPDQSEPATPDPVPQETLDTEDVSFLEGYRRGRGSVPFSEMTYIRPDIQEMRRAVKEQVGVIRRGESLEQVFEAMLAAGQVLNEFDTMYTIADIYSDADMGDDYWWDEYSFCRSSYRTYSSLWGDVYEAIEKSGYAEQLLPLWDASPTYEEPESRDARRSMQLSERIDAISDQALDILDYATVRYAGRDLTLDEAYNHSDWVEATAAWCEAYGPELLELYTRMAEAGDELARTCYGHDDYAAYLFDQYRRDYSPQAALALIDEIVEAILPLDDELYDLGYWSALRGDYKDFNSLMKIARVVLGQMGGEMVGALDYMLDYGFYYNEVGPRQYGRAYVIYMAEPNAPFLYCPFDDTLRSSVDFTHEFGHFYEIYLTMEEYCIPDDLSEVHSQAMTLLFSQAYADQTGDGALLEGALTDTVDTLLSQSLNAAIELRVFALAPEELTAEAVGAIGREQSARFGYWQRDPQMAAYMWLTDSELFTDPLQPLCYTVSAGAALELWTLSLEDMEAALDKYDRLVRHPQSHLFLDNLEAAGLAGPFVPGWAESTEGFLRAQLLPDTAAEAA